MVAKDLPCRPFIEDFDWHPISLDKALWIERPFEEEEICKAIFSLGSGKVPGPDGFTFVFFQNCWDIFKLELLKVFAEFFLNGKIGVYNLYLPYP